MSRIANKKNTAARRQQAPSVTHVEVTPDAIRCRAYEIYCERNGGNGGDHFSDWLRAERELAAVAHDEPTPGVTRSANTAERRPLMNR